METTTRDMGFLGYRAVVDLRQFSKFRVVRDVCENTCKKEALILLLYLGLCVLTLLGLGGSAGPGSHGTPF